MMEDNYSKAYKEIVEILKYVPEESVNKIPKEMRDMFEAEQLKTYNFQIDTFPALTGSYFYSFPQYIFYLSLPVLFFGINLPYHYLQINIHFFHFLHNMLNH